MSDASSAEASYDTWSVTRAVVEDVRVAHLGLTGLPHLPATIRRRAFFQPVTLELEYRRSLTGEWFLKRAEASGPICHADGEPGPDANDLHIFSWLTPELPTRANSMGVPDWVLELGRQYKPQDQPADRTAGK